LGLFLTAIAKPPFPLKYRIAIRLDSSHTTRGLIWLPGRSQLVACEADRAGSDQGNPGACRCGVPDRHEHSPHAKRSSDRVGSPLSLGRPRVCGPPRRLGLLLRGILELRSGFGLLDLESAMATRLGTWKFLY